MAVKMQVEVFWVAMLCSIVVGYQRFGEPCCLHLYPETSVSYHNTIWHNLTCILTTMTSSNLTSILPSFWVHE